MAHPYPIREIARRAGLSEATVDRVLNARGGVRQSTVQEVHRAIVDVHRQRSQMRLTGRTFFPDLVVDTSRWIAYVGLDNRAAGAASCSTGLSARPGARRRRRRGAGHPGGRLLPRGGRPRDGVPRDLALLQDGRLSAVLHHDLALDLRRACHVVMQAHGALPGLPRSWHSNVHVVTPYNTPAELPR